MSFTLEDLQKKYQEHAVNLQKVQQNLQHFTTLMHQITGAMAALEQMIKEANESKKGEENATEERVEQESDTTEH